MVTDVPRSAVGSRLVRYSIISGRWVFPCSLSRKFGFQVLVIGLTVCARCIISQLTYTLGGSIFK